MALATDPTEEEEEEAEETAEYSLWLPQLLGIFSVRYTLKLDS